MTEPDKPAEPTHSFTVAATWSGDGMGCGKLHLPQGNLTLAIGGAKSLGGCGLGANPEELLLASIAACFVNTWAIFLKKLGITYAEPAVRVSGDLGVDPAGGYRMLQATIHAVVPRTLLMDQRAQVEKTLQLAEKYCIISKATRAAMPLRVEMEEA